MSTFRTATAGVLALGIALATAGCAPAPSPAPSVEPVAIEPTVTPSPEPVPDAPQPTIGVTCAELLSTATIAANMPPGVALADMARAELAGASGVGIPTSAFVRAMGGLACEWNNGQPYDGSGTNPAYLGVRVLVLPDARAHFDRFERIYGSSPYCASAVVPLYCTRDAMIGTAWLSAEIIGSASDSAAGVIGDEIIAALSTAGPGASPWTPPAGTIPLSADCDAILPVTPVGSLLGVGVPLLNQGSDGGGGGRNLNLSAREESGSADCYYTYEGSMAGVASIQTLPAGAWAWREARPLITEPAAPARVEIALLGEGDEAWVRCTTDGHTCLLDLVVGENWIQLQVWDTQVVSEAARVTVDPRAGILRLGEAVLGELRG